MLPRLFTLIAGAVMALSAPLLAAAPADQSGGFDPASLAPVFRNVSAVVRQGQVKPLSNRDMEEAARKANEVFQSPEVQQRIRAYSSELQKGRFSSQASRYYANADGGKEKRKSKGRLAPDERLYVFVSSSIPDEVLLRYADDVDRLGDPRTALALRGFVGGARQIGPTSTFLEKVAKVDPSCRGDACKTRKTGVIIDPEAFRRFRVSAVPVVVFVKGVGPGKEAGTARWKITGDVPLGYALERFSKSGAGATVEAMARTLGNR